MALTYYEVLEDSSLDNLKYGALAGLTDYIDKAYDAVEALVACEVGLEVTATQLFNIRSNRRKLGSLVNDIRVLTGDLQLYRASSLPTVVLPYQIFIERDVREDLMTRAQTNADLPTGYDYVNCDPLILRMINLCDMTGAATWPSTVAGLNTGFTTTGTVTSTSKTVNGQLATLGAGSSIQYRVCDITELTHDYSYYVENYETISGYADTSISTPVVDGVLYFRISYSGAGTQAVTIKNIVVFDYTASLTPASKDAIRVMMASWFTTNSYITGQFTTSTMIPTYKVASTTRALTGVDPETLEDNLLSLIPDVSRDLGDFAFACTFRTTGVSSSTKYPIFTNFTKLQNRGIGLGLVAGTTTSLCLYVPYDGGTIPSFITFPGTYSIEPNTFYDVALFFSSTYQDVDLYINGGFVSSVNRTTLMADNYTTGTSQDFKVMWASNIDVGAGIHYLYGDTTNFTAYTNYTLKGEYTSNSTFIEAVIEHRTYVCEYLNTGGWTSVAWVEAEDWVDADNWLD